MAYVMVNNKLVTVNGKAIMIDGSSGGVSLNDITILVADFADAASYTITSGGCNSTTREMVG